MAKPTFKKIQLVERVYESDAVTSARTAKALAAYQDHVDNCQRRWMNGLISDPCGGGSGPGSGCEQGQALYRLAKKKSEKRFDEVPVTA